MPDKLNLEPSPYGDFVLPFDIAKAGVRGRLVRLDASSTRALSAHALPEAGGAGGRRDAGAGRFAGNRAEAGRAADRPDQGRRPARSGDRRLLWRRSEDTPSRRARLMPGWMASVSPRWTAEAFAKLAGKGALAITIEPRLGGQTYQGIVELSPRRHRRFGGNLFRPVRATAHRDPAGGGAALCGGRQAAALARRRHHAADDAGSGQGRDRKAKSRRPMTGSGCRCC